jgi:hypothetical protein
MISSIKLWATPVVMKWFWLWAHLTYPCLTVITSSLSEAQEAKSFYANFSMKLVWSESFLYLAASYMQKLDSSTIIIVKGLESNLLRSKDRASRRCVLTNRSADIHATDDLFSRRRAWCKLLQWSVVPWWCRSTELRLEQSRQTKG